MSVIAADREARVDMESHRDSEKSTIFLGEGAALACTVQAPILTSGKTAPPDFALAKSNLALRPVL